MWHFVHFLSRERKRTKRKRPCYAALRAALRFSKRAGVVKLAGAQTVTTPFSPPSAMLGASQRGAGQNHLDCQLFYGDFLLPKNTLDMHYWDFRRDLTQVMPTIPRMR